MTKIVAQIFGILVLGLALVGLMVGETKLFNLMNVDMTLDLLRIPIAAALLYAGFMAKDEATIKSIVLGFGVLYIGMGLLGLVSPTLYGLLPNGLTGFDLAFHLITGVAAVGVAMTRGRHAVTP